MVKQILYLVFNILTAFNAVANGGTLIKPHVMKEIAHYDESKNVDITDKKFDISGNNSKKILDSDKVAQLRGYLEKVVSEGGGKKAFIEGYHIAGKTGTAQKAGSWRIPTRKICSIICRNGTSK